MDLIKIKMLNDEVWRQLDSERRKDYPRAIKIGMSEYMHLVREESVDEIVPDRTGLPDFEDFRFRRMKYLDQPTHPTKLTSRSGRLLAGLKEGNREVFQNLDHRVSKTNPSIFKSLQGKIVGGGQAGRMTSSVERFSGTWTPYIRDGSAMLENFRNMGYHISKGDAKKQLAFRFKWETGIRGHKRMYLYPAHLKNQNRLTPIMMSAMERYYVRKFNS